MTGPQTTLSAVQLQSLTEQLSLRWFRRPFVHEAVYNPRLRTTGGRYMLRDHSIQVNPAVEAMYGADELIGVLKHELCHYHLHIEGRGYKHGDTDFKELLKETGSPRYCRPLRAARPAAVRRYRCTSCGRQYERQRRVDTDRYRCGKCRGKLEELPRDQL